MNNNYKIYGETLNTWISTDDNGVRHLNQIEIAYKEYNAEGELVGTGSEDFSEERLYKTMMTKYVYAWDGKKLNKGNKRWFKCLGMIKYNRKDVKIIKENLKKKHNAEIIELR